MYAPTRYLSWARRFHGRARIDLASSGIPGVPLAELGVPDSERLDDPRGWERLREAIARYNAVPAEECVAALGTSHALWLAYAALTNPGDEVLVESPTYEPLIRAAEGVGARVRRFARGREDFAVDPAVVLGALTPQTRVVALASLHNPSGLRADEEALCEIARALEARSVHLLVDEVYAPFDGFVDAGVFQGTHRRLGENVVTVGSLTKCYGLGPLRVGWLLGSAEVVRRAEDVLTATVGLMPLPHAVMAAHAFERVGDLAARSARILEGKREIVAAWARARGLRFSGPHEGPFGLVTLAREVDLQPLVEDAVQKEGVLVTPGSFFELPSSVRIAWTAPSETLVEGLEGLARVLDLAGLIR
jgi:aspartate/methionine/tyrosine aminotransferase